MSEVLFELRGEPVRRGDLLYLSPEYYRRAGAIVTAEFAPEGDMVTVRSANGAVPSVPVSSLSKTYPIPETPPDAPPRIVKEFEEIVVRKESYIRQLKHEITQAVKAETERCVKILGKYISHGHNDQLQVYANLVLQDTIKALEAK